MIDAVVPIFVVLIVFGAPTSLLALHLRQRHREKMKALESQVSSERVAALEASRNDLEARVRTLESIVTAPDDLEARLRRLEASAQPSLPPRS
jgi:hypothetical protein